LLLETLEERLIEQNRRVAEQIVTVGHDGNDTASDNAIEISFANQSESSSPPPSYSGLSLNRHDMSAPQVKTTLMSRSPLVTDLMREDLYDLPKRFVHDPSLH
jgi:hypothetical protein